MKNYKKALAISSSTIFLFLLFSIGARAAIVPCGSPSTASPEMCTLCHLILGIVNIVTFAFGIFVGVAILMIVVAGIMYIVSSGNTAMIESAKKLMKSALAGFALVLLAWLIVNYTLLLISAETDLGVNATNWYTFTCSTASNANSGSNPTNVGDNPAFGPR